MNAILSPAKLEGTLPALPSKSQAHRFMICAALARDTTVIACQSAGQDMAATARCLRALGAEITHGVQGYTIRPIANPPKRAILDVGESGSTLRFLLPVVCALGVEATFQCHGRLADRPLEPLWSELSRCGAVLSREGNTIRTSGKLAERHFSLAANVSSQFLSGILLALPMIGGGTLTLEGTLESEAYLRMTLAALEDFGLHISRQGGTFSVPPEPLQSPGKCAVEGDWSNAAFWLCANAIGNHITLTGLNSESIQSDRAVIAAMEAIRKGNAEIDCSQIPDLLPPLAVLAALCPGETVFSNARRLRYKESDRLRACAALLTGLGGKVAEHPEGLRVWGQARLCGGTVDSFGDHRIAMAAAIAATGCDGSVTLGNARATEKSYAAFWDDYCRLGGIIRWEDAT